MLFADRGRQRSFFRGARPSLGEYRVALPRRPGVRRQRRRIPLARRSGPPTLTLDAPEHAVDACDDDGPVSRFDCRYLQTSGCIKFALEPGGLARVYPLSCAHGLPGVACRAAE